MTEISLARILHGQGKAHEHIAESDASVEADEFYFNDHYLNRTIEIEGFGKVEITPEGPIRINSEQLIHLKEFEAAHKDQPVSESVSLEDGTFLVSLKSS